ncbi:hypothetical protein RRG08_000130 [Elysia crispata]|uniref:Uncharacterized protein n=1 Tax=Elysia crispata TaxID=231223 RepID=A0AAE0YVF9_9GAST|nr:hypothetical protein RRG08_000130 [Elysia crispata]
MCKKGWHFKPSSALTEERQAKYNTDAKSCVRFNALQEMRGREVQIQEQNLKKKKKRIKLSPGRESFSGAAIHSTPSDAFPISLGHQSSFENTVCFYILSGGIFRILKGLTQSPLYFPRCMILMIYKGVLKLFIPHWAAQHQRVVLCAQPPASGDGDLDIPHIQPMCGSTNPERP